MKHFAWFLMVVALSSFGAQAQSAPDVGGAARSSWSARVELTKIKHLLITSSFLRFARPRGTARPLGA